MCSQVEPWLIMEPLPFGASSIDGLTLCQFLPWRLDQGQKMNSNLFLAKETHHDYHRITIGFL